MNESKKIVIELSNDEALVFFEWLAKFNEQEGHAFEDQAEERVLFDLEAKMESILTQPLDPNYRELLKQARDRVRDES